MKRINPVNFQRIFFHHDLVHQRGEEPPPAFVRQRLKPLEH